MQDSQSCSGYIYTIKTRSQFRNVSVTVGVVEVRVVDTRYAAASDAER